MPDIPRWLAALHGHAIRLTRFDPAFLEATSLSCSCGWSEPDITYYVDDSAASDWEAHVLWEIAITQSK